MSKKLLGNKEVDVNKVRVCKGGIEMLVKGVSKLDFLGCALMHVYTDTYRAPFKLAIKIPGYKEAEIELRKKYGSDEQMLYLNDALIKYNWFLANAEVDDKDEDTSFFGDLYREKQVELKHK